MSFVKGELRAMMFAPLHRWILSLSKIAALSLTAAVALSLYSVILEHQHHIEHFSPMQEESPRPVMSSPLPPAERKELQRKSDLVARSNDLNNSAALSLPPRPDVQSRGPSHNAMVGGAPMYTNKSTVENAINSKDHTTLVAAVKAAGLIGTLSGPGPFTVFAPTNAAFAKLPKGTIDNLLKPENKGQLQALLNYHVLNGTLSVKDIQILIKKGGGKAEIKTVQGEPLTFKQVGEGIEVIDSKGDHSKVTVPNVIQSNGVMHVINTVMLP